MNALRWGLLSTANIGAKVVGATKRSEVTDFVAVASRDEKRARQFADSNGLAEGLGSYEALLESDGVDLQLAATMRLPSSGPLAQFDIGLRHPRHDELELIGTDGKIVVSDPWLCRSVSIELWRNGRSESLPVDPDNRFDITHDDDVYRIAFDTVSKAILTGSAPAFGRDDAVAQARLLEAIRLSAARSEPVDIG